MTLVLILIITALGKLEIYKFPDRTVAVWDNSDRISITITSPVELEVVRTDDGTRFKTLTNSEVFHSLDCSIVKDRSDALLITPEQALLKRPCFFCKPI